MKLKEQQNMVTKSKKKVSTPAQTTPQTTDVIEYELNRSRACMRRMMKLNMSDKEITDMLGDHQKRLQFGYMYLVQKETE